ncbi:uncharacterized protein B0T15DRAFT_488571 [Chaetomium strumarium]|uniref:Uncharacterized protein n=1 Tax=Chaetomium strumarium TaxID=1170767 RepID=A0AAJ0H125_9PEZI|nr:hypothetical protein B0T15DRAFT_488571 [Chaetomium strumarium]
MAEPTNPPEQSHLPNAFVPGTLIANSVAQARHVDPAKVSNKHYPPGFKERWMEAYRGNPDVEHIQLSSRVKPRRWRHACKSPGINHVVDLVPADGVFREGITCPYLGCGYVTDADTPLVNGIGDPIETMRGLNLIDGVGPFNRFWRYWFECCRCTRWKSNDLLKIGDWRSRRKAVPDDNCEHCGVYVEIDCDYCVSYNFYKEPVEFMDGKPFPFGAVWRHKEVGGGKFHIVEDSDAGGWRILSRYPHGRGSWTGSEDWRLERIKKPESLF